MIVRRTLRISLGAALWVGVFGWTVWLATRESPTGASTLSKIGDHLTRKSLEVTVEFERPVLLEIGDAVLLEGSEDEVIGEIVVLLDSNGKEHPASFRQVTSARMLLFDRDRSAPRRDARLRLSVVPGSGDTGAWLWDTLINERTAPRIREAWSRNDLLPHKNRIAEMLVPVLHALLADAEKTLQEEARPFLERHRPEIERLIGKVESELGKNELAQLFESEVWPPLKTRLDPVLDEIGGEIWERVPIWGFGWRVVFQSLPFTSDDHFKKRWNVFVDKEVVPVLRSHSDDIVEVSRQVARDLLTNPRIGVYLREFFLRLGTDPEFHRVGWDFVREVFLENPRFRRRVKDRWESEEVREVVEFVSKKLEPTVREIGDIVLGTRESGITPEFARVLRTQILEKDRQRLILAPGDAAAPALDDGARITAGVEIEAP